MDYLKLMFSLVLWLSRSSMLITEVSGKSIATPLYENSESQGSHSRIVRSISGASFLNSSMVEHIVLVKERTRKSIHVYRRDHPQLAVSSYQRSYRTWKSRTDACEPYNSQIRNQRTMKREIRQYYCAVLNSPYIRLSSIRSARPRWTREMLLSSLSDLICELGNSHRCGILTCPPNRLSLHETHSLSGYRGVLVPLERLLYCSIQQWRRQERYSTFRHDVTTPLNMMQPTVSHRK